MIIYNINYSIIITYTQTNGLWPCQVGTSIDHSCQVMEAFPQRQLRLRRMSKIRKINKDSQC